MKKNKIRFVFSGFFERKRSELFRGLQLFLLIMFLGCPLFGVAQQQKVSIDVKQVDVSVVFRQIKEQTKLNFVYDPDQLASMSKVTLNVQNVTVDVALQRLFEGTSFEYRFEMGAILIKRKEKSQQDEGEVVTITGTVKDVEGNPLPGVTVMLKGLTLGAATDIDGKYALNFTKVDDIVFVFSFIGMETQEVKYTGQSKVDVVLKEAVESMEEVVVTGIFTRKKEGFTGSTTHVSGDDIKRMTSGNVLKALEMLDPSFRMNSSNLAGSNPNAVPDFQMRGQASMGNYQSDDVVVLRGDVNTRPNQPLFVLDGVIGVDATTIMDLDPEQVASITLLKDAAATVIYGSEAANGVVVVETKAPQMGKLRFTYNGNYSLEWPDLSVYDLMDAEEKLKIEELAGFYDYKDYVDIMSDYNKLRQEVMRGVNTYWLAEPVKTAFTHRHGLTVEGGDPTLRYKIYLGAKWAPGVMKETDLNTKTGKIDLSYRNHKLLINNQLSVDYSDGRRVSPYGSLQEYASLNPYYRRRDENGNIRRELNVPGTSYGNPVLNPLWDTQFESKNDSRSFELREALKVEYLPIESLRLSLDFTLNKSDGTVEIFNSAQDNAFYEEKDPAKKGLYEWTKTEGNKFRLSLSAAYTKSFGDHLLAAFARYSINENSSKTTKLSMLGFPNDKLSEVYMGTEHKNTSGSESVARSLAMVMTLNYSYKQRYAVDYSMSINASSEFGKNNRYAPFWSAGLRWNIDKENFIKNLGFFDELVLRGTYGITGSQGFTPLTSLYRCIRIKI